MEAKSNSDIFHYLMDMVGDDSKGNENSLVEKELSVLLKKELDNDAEVSDDDIDDILEENIIAEKIKELNVSNSDEDNDIKELMGLPKVEKVDCSEDLEMLSSAIKFNRELKQMLQEMECKLLAVKRKIISEEESIKSLTITKAVLDKGTDFYTSYLTPYFRDGQFRCPPNRDEIAKRYVKPMLYQEESEQCTKWNANEIKALEIAIKDTIINNFLSKVDKNTDDKKQRHSVMTKLNFIRKCSLAKIFDKIEVEPLDWDVISSRMSKPHSTRDCKVIRDLYLDPKINRKKWTKAESQSLLLIGKELKFQNWTEIAKRLGSGRSGYQCFMHYQRSLSKRELKWTAKEFSLLKGIVEATRVNGKDINWSKVLWYYDSQSFDKLYCKWYKTMCPTGKEARKGKFNYTEDKCIIQAVKKDGIPIRDIPKLLPYRNVAQIRERFMNSLSQPNKIYGAWTAEEDKLLMKLVEEHGVGKWAKIASLMKNRSRTQVRQHYNHIKTVMMKNPNCTFTTYRTKKGYTRKRNRVSELVKRVEKSGKGGPAVHNYNLPSTTDKYGEDAELLKYFVYQRKNLQYRQSIGNSFEKNEENILRICNMLGLNLPPKVSVLEPVNSFSQEYIYEAIKFLKRKKIELSSCRPLQCSLSLFPPSINNVNSLRNLMLRLEDEKEIFETNFKDINDVKGPQYNSALSNWMKRLYVIFAVAFMLKNIKLTDYNKIAKNKVISEL